MTHAYTYTQSSFIAFWEKKTHILLFPYKYYIYMEGCRDYIVNIL